MKTFFFILTTLLICAISASAQNDTIRIATYNVLNWPEDSPNTREAYFQMILEEIDPDLLIGQEFQSEAGANRFLNDILDPEVYSRSRARLQFTNDVVLFYKHDLFEITDEIPVQTTLRDITVFELNYLNEEIEAPPLYFAGAHLKAGSTEADEGNRRSEARTFVREIQNNYLDVHLIFGGDLNLYGSGEPAYQSLIADSMLYDPLSRSGTWHESVRHIDIHTQSTRDRLVGTGSSGGLDDRFDFLLLSNEFNQAGGWTYLADSYHSFGNDGNPDRLNQSIMWGRNTAVSAEMAEALYYASDHLPVVAELIVSPPQHVADNDQAFTPASPVLIAYPNPFNSMISLSFDLETPATAQLSIYSLGGVEITRLINQQLAAGRQHQYWDAAGQANGVYFALLRADGQTSWQKIMLLR